MADMRSSPAPTLPRARRPTPSWLALALLLAACATPRVSPVAATPTAERPTPSPATTPSPSPSVGPVARDSLRGTIAYSSDVAGNDDVYLLQLGNGGPVRLTDGPEKEFDPAISPDGTRIAYRRNPRAGSDAADIWLMNADGSGKRNLTNAPERSNWAPAWTPDGRIAFSRTSDTAQALELWTMAAEGSDARRVSEGWCEYVVPSPDGSMFACASAVGGQYDIVIVDAATGARRPLMTTPQTEFGPSWSPDGAWITFSRDFGERWALLRIRPDGSDEQEVAPEGVFSTWDPDGHLVWSGPGGINVANSDGSGGIVLDVPGSFVSWAAP
jgi:dipeptidyl aminopeptidase/acylaminoacyl peptidase